MQLDHDCEPFLPQNFKRIDRCVQGGQIVFKPLFRQVQILGLGSSNPFLTRDGFLEKPVTAELQLQEQGEAETV